MVVSGIGNELVHVPLSEERAVVGDHWFVYDNNKEWKMICHHNHSHWIKPIPKEWKNMGYSYTCDDLCVPAEAEGTTDKEITVEISLICIDPGSSPSCLYGPPEFYDPGEGPSWEIEMIELVLEDGKPLSVSPKQFGAMFPRADKIMEEAIEDAVENGDVND